MSAIRAGSIEDCGFVSGAVIFLAGFVDDSDHGPSSGGVVVFGRDASVTAVARDHYAVVFSASDAIECNQGRSIDRTVDAQRLNHDESLAVEALVLDGGVGRSEDVCGLH